MRVSPPAPALDPAPAGSRHSTLRALEPSRPYRAAPRSANGVQPATAPLRTLLAAFLRGR